MKIQLIEKSEWERLNDLGKAFELIAVATQPQENARRPTRMYLVNFIAAQAGELYLTTQLLEKTRTQSMIFAILFGGMTLVAATGWMIIGWKWFGLL